MKSHQSWPFNLVQDFRYGKLIYNQLDTYIGKSIKLYGEFSRGEAVLFDDLIHEGDTVVEAGANIGSHTVHFAQLVGTGGEVYAFEPQRLVYQLLCGNVAINSLANVYTYRCGIGSESGKLHVPELSPEQIHNWGGVSLLGQEQGEEVPLVTIDSYHLQACDFIKIDVEGMELAVLKGAEATIRAFAPVIYLEANEADEEAAVAQYLVPLGYRIYRHQPPMYSKDNYFHNPEDAFRVEQTREDGKTYPVEIVSMNLLCLPPQVELPTAAKHQLTPLEIHAAERPQPHAETAEGAIHILYAISDKKGSYAKFLGTSMLSVMEHTQAALVFHIFHDGTLTAENRKKLRRMVHEHGGKLKLYDVRELAKELFAEAERIFRQGMQDTRYTEAALYRLVAPQVLPAEVRRLIYLDADTVVHMDIEKLWREPVGASGMAAVRERTLLTHYHARGSKESKEKVYNRMTEAGVTLANCFNSGVLLMDLDRLRERGDILLPGLRFLAQYPGESKFYDQDILNYYFAKELTPLPWNYNILLHWDKQFGAPVLTEGIYHFMGHSLELKEDDPRDTLFFDVFIRTPWFGGKFLEHFGTTMEQIYELTVVPWMEQARKLFLATLTRHPVLAATEEMLPSLLRLHRNPLAIHRPEAAKEDEEKLTPEEARDFFKKEGIPFVLFGSEEKGLNLALPYDIDACCYLIFAADHKKVEGALLAAGLQRGTQFLNANFLLNGKAWLHRVIQPQKFIEAL